MTQLPQTADRFDPAEAVLDQFPFLLTDLIRAVPGRAPIDRAAPVRRLWGEVRRHLHAAALGDTVAGVVALVPRNRDAMSARQIFDPDARGIAVAVARRRRHGRVHDQPVSFVRRSPWTLLVGLPPASDGGSSSRRRKLL